LAQLVEIRRYIQRDKPDAARRIAIRIVASVAGLVGHPHLGHVGRKIATRELVVPGTPYIIVHRTEAERLVVLAVLHGAQRR
jgi:plasmid stabilization system protein ParE